MISTVARRAVTALLWSVAVVGVAEPVSAQPAPDDGSMLDPSSPLDPMSDFGVEWPDEAIKADAPPLVEGEAPAAPQGEPIAEAPAVEASADLTDAEAERRYTVAIDGMDAINASHIRARFNALSALMARHGSAANTAQIDRRARADEKLLRELLRAEGYYAAAVSTRVDAIGDRIGVSLIVEPGPLFHFTHVAVLGLEGTEAASARPAFNISEGDPVNAAAVLAATDRLRKELFDNGFPFAKVEEPDVTVDYADNDAELALAVAPGHLAHFGDFQVSGAKAPFGVKHVRRISRLKRGEIYKAADLEDLRRAIIATGLVSAVTLVPVPTPDPAVVDVSVALEPAPMRTIAGEFGYGTGEGFRAAVSWTHRNMIRPEGAVTFRGVAGTQEQYLGALLRRSNFKRRDQVLTAQVAASHVNRNAYDARTFTLGAGLERKSSIIWQKKWTWSVGTELVASDERDTIVVTGVSRRRTFYIAALPGSLAYDGSDDLLDPTRGFRLSGRLSPELSFHSGSFTYARAQIDASAYQPLGKGFVLAGRVRVGTIAGAQRDQIAPSRRYYSGGGGSVRGYGYQDIGPRDVDNDPIGGRSVSEFSLEGRVRFGDFGVVGFLDGGNIYTQSMPRFTGLRYGTGVGVRYYTSFGPIRVDVGTPLNRRQGDPRAAVYVSLGQAF